jgi:hypothetical protein
MSGSAKAAAVTFTEGSATMSMSGGATVTGTVNFASNNNRIAVSSIASAKAATITYSPVSYYTAGNTVLSGDPANNYTKFEMKDYCPSGRTSWDAATRYSDNDMPKWKINSNGTIRRGKATGGDGGYYITTDNGASWDEVHVFNNGGTLTVNYNVTGAWYLVVGGGGGSGGRRGSSAHDSGAGGAGGVGSNAGSNSSAYTSNEFTTGSYTITTGPGGNAGSSGYNTGSNGGDSKIVGGSINWYAGGGGGGCGGATSDGGDERNGNPGNMTTPPGYSSNGFKGAGDNGGIPGTWYCGGVDTNGTGNGGFVSTITGSAFTYSRGGDAYHDAHAPSNSGCGGGAEDDYEVGAQAGYTGGSGIVVVRWHFQ